ESVKHRQPTIKSAPQCGSGKSRSPTVRPYTLMHLQIVEADRQLTWRYVASGPHGWAMWIGLKERGSAGGAGQTAGCEESRCSGRGDMIGIPLPNILVIRHFQERMAHGLFVPDVPSGTLGAPAYFLCGALIKRHPPMLGDGTAYLRGR